MHTFYTIEDRKIVPTQDESACISVYVAPTPEEKRFLIDKLKIDEHTLNSALDPDELSRLEFEPEHAALIYKRPKNYSSSDQFFLKVASTGVFLFKDRMVIVTCEDYQVFAGVQATASATPRLLLLKLLYRSIVHFLEHLRIVSKISDELQNKINQSMENRHLLNMFTLEKSLVYYLSSINSNGLLVERLRNSAGKLGFTQEELEFLDDIVIENTQCSKQAEIDSNILASMMDARASIVNNNLNNLMKTLNVITITIMVPTLVVSIFSMNVPIPLQEHWLSFYLVVVLAAFSGWAFLFFWNRRK